MQSSNEDNLPFSFFVTLYSCGQTKVANLDAHVIIKKQVPKFQISMDNFCIMKVNAANENLFHVVSHLRFSKSLSSLVQLHQRLFKICRNIAQLKVELPAVSRHCTMELQSCTDFIPTCNFIFAVS